MRRGTDKSHKTWVILLLTAVVGAALAGAGGCLYVDKFQAQRVLIDAQVLADDYHPRIFEHHTLPATGRVWGTSTTAVEPKPGQTQPIDSVVVVPFYHHCERGGFYEILGVRRIDCKTGYVSYPARYCTNIIFFARSVGWGWPFAAYYVAGSDV